MDIKTYLEEGAFFYVLPDQLGYDLILGLPWMKKFDARIEIKRGRLYLRTTGARIYDRGKRPLPATEILQISTSVMGAYIRRSRHTDTP